MDLWWVWDLKLFLFGLETWFFWFVFSRKDNVILGGNILIFLFPTESHHSRSYVYARRFFSRALLDFQVLLDFQRFANSRLLLNRHRLNGLFLFIFWSVFLEHERFAFILFLLIYNYGFRLLLDDLLFNYFLHFANLLDNFLVLVIFW